MVDVAVVGGGPVGCHAAALMGGKGLDVHLFEEHPVIGEPVDCSGVIGAEGFETLGLSKSIQLGEIGSLDFVSPSKLEVRFLPPSPLAYVVDRADFDRSVASSAISCGTSFRMGCRVIDLQPRSDGVEVIFSDAGSASAPNGNGRGVKKLKASIVILAHGPRYRIQRKLGMGWPGKFLRTAQTEVNVQGIEGTRILLGSDTAPGSFAWIVPFQRQGAGFARIGVSTQKNPAPYLKKLLKQLYRSGCVNSAEVPIRTWMIPITPLARTYAERVLVVGDAAGQTKPTSGGGIYYGLLCAEAAAETAVEALEKGDLSALGLKGYEERWRQRLGREIRSGALLRRLAERLTDDEIDDLFRVVQSDGVLAAVTRKARFDWHKDVIYFALRHPALGRIFLRGLFR